MTAIHLDPCRDRPQSRTRHAALDALDDAAHWFIATFREWGRRLRERDQLARMDERMLLDIGLSHAERVFLANKPFWRE